MISQVMKVKEAHELTHVRRWFETINLAEKTWDSEEELPKIYRWYNT
jgi:hypothetical protein